MTDMYLRMQALPSAVRYRPDAGPSPMSGAADAPGAMIPKMINKFPPPVNRVIREIRGSPFCVSCKSRRGLVAVSESH
jgi:hypothetical protein